MGIWEGPGGYRYSPPRYPPGYPPRIHPSPLPRVHPSHHGPLHAVLDHGAREPNKAVGLISVDQLSLDVLISGFRGMTEVYNLIEIGRIINHYVIPGNEKAGVSNPWTRPILPQQSSIKL